MTRNWFIFSYPYNFATSGTHKVILSGTSLQTVNFDIRGSAYFNILEITNSSADGVKFVNTTRVRKELKTTTTPIINSKNLYLNETAIISGGNWPYDLSLRDTWTLQQDQVIEGSVYSPTGKLKLNNYNFTVFHDMYLDSGSIELQGGTLSVGGIIRNSGDEIYIGGGRLIVAGDYQAVSNTTVYCSGTLIMVNQSDYVQVGGNYRVEKTSSDAGNLTAGTLEIKGNFTQKHSLWSSSFANFCASGTHKVILSGSRKQTVSFQDPSASKFNILELTKPFNSGYSFNHIPVWKTLIEKTLIDLSFGESPAWCNSVAEPVNVITGNYYSTDKDLSINTQSVPLEFVRSYNSRSDYNGPLGKGWTHNYNAFLTINYDNSVTVNYGDGHSAVYPLQNGVYTRPAGCFETLQKNADNTYTLTFKDQLKHVFDSNGRLIQIIDKNENITQLTYSNSLLSQVKEPGGRSLQFTYSTGGKLQLITDPAGRTLQFAYDTNGNMISFTDLNGETTTYSYGEYGLTSILDPLNHYIVRNTYDQESQVTEQMDSKGQIVTISYDATNRKNIFTDALGKTTVYYYDDKYRNTRIEYMDGTSVSYAYDNDYNKISETDARGNTTTYTYDTMGNMLSQTAPAPLGYTITYAYGSLNNPVSITDEAGHVTNFIYDTKGNLLQTSKTIDGQTAETSYTYNQYRQLPRSLTLMGRPARLPMTSMGTRSRPLIQIIILPVIPMTL